MKHKLLLIIFITAFFSCKENSDTNNNTVATEVSQEDLTAESNRKIIEICKNMDGIIDADILDDKLTLRANISKVEGQKLSDGILKEIRKYNQNINTVIVFDLGFDLVGHSGKK